MELRQIRFELGEWMSPVILMDIIVSGNSHHSSLSPPRVTAGDAAFAVTALCHELGVHTFQLNVLQLVLPFHSPYFKKTVQIFSFGLADARHIKNMLCSLNDEVM